MNAMNRLYYLYDECSPKAQFEERELSLYFMRPSIDKHKRKNCVFDIGLQL